MTLAEKNQHLGAIHLDETLKKKRYDDQFSLYEKLKTCFDSDQIISAEGADLEWMLENTDILVLDETLTQSEITALTE